MVYFIHVHRSWQTIHNMLRCNTAVVMIVYSFLQIYLSIGFLLKIGPLDDVLRYRDFPRNRDFPWKDEPDCTIRTYVSAVTLISVLCSCLMESIYNLVFVKLYEYNELLPWCVNWGLMLINYVVTTVISIFLLGIFTLSKLEVHASFCLLTNPGFYFCMVCMMILCLIREQVKEKVFDIIVAYTQQRSTYHFHRSTYYFQGSTYHFQRYGVRQTIYSRVTTGWSYTNMSGIAKAGCIILMMAFGRVCLSIIISYFSNLFQTSTYTNELGVLSLLIFLIVRVSFIIKMIVPFNMDSEIRSAVGILLQGDSK